MYIHYIKNLLTWFILTALGPFIYVFFPKDWGWKSKDNRGIGKFKNKFIDSIWGNAIDGLSGDSPYRNHEAKSPLRKLWPNFWWSCIRNPANNYVRGVSKSRIITNIDHRGHLTIVRFGRHRVFFFYTPDWPIMFKLGYKLWPDDPALKVGRQYKPKLAFSIQRGNKI